MKLPVSINEDDFTLLIKNTTKEKYKVAFLLGFGSGLRISEIVNLKKENIDIKENTIFISQSKGKKDRVVPLPKGFKKSFLSYIPLGYTNSRYLQIIFKKTAIRSGLIKKKPDATFHSLRHGFAQNCLKKGMPIHYVQSLLGHSNVATTGIYLKANPKDALKSYEEVW